MFPRSTGPRRPGLAVFDTRTSWTFGFVSPCVRDLEPARTLVYTERALPVAIKSGPPPQIVNSFSIGDADAVLEWKVRPRLVRQC